MCVCVYIYIIYKIVCVWVVCVWVYNILATSDQVTTLVRIVIKLNILCKCVVNRKLHVAITLSVL